MKCDTLAERLHLARRRAGLGQRELAAKVGVTLAAVSGWETGMRIPRQAAIPLIAAALGVEVEELACADAPAAEEQVA